MSRALIEAEFLIPIRRDAGLSDGKKHSVHSWNRLQTEMYLRFGADATLCPGLYRGAYRDPDTGKRVADQSRKYFIAVQRSKLNELRRVLAVAAIIFQQKCIYLSVAGRVEFIEPLHEISPEKILGFGWPRD